MAGSVSKGTLFKRFVEPGRVALITYGPCEGKMCTVVEICTQKKVIVDGPESVTGVRRHLMPVRRLSLTDFKCKIPRGAREKTLKKALKAEQTYENFKKSSWGQKLKNREVRADMSDFDRFKLMLAKKKRTKALKAAKK